MIETEAEIDKVTAAVVRAEGPERREAFALPNKGPPFVRARMCLAYTLHCVI
jgi:hypothetical protein